LGYDISNFRNAVLSVPISDLQKNSHSKVFVKCDYCEKIIEKEYRAYLKERNSSIIKKDSCLLCHVLKSEESNLITYGAKNVMQVDSIREKLKVSLLCKYGITNWFFKKDFHKELQEKLKNRSEEKKKFSLEKSRKTCIERYGVRSALQMKKTRENLFKTIERGSKQQNKIFEMISVFYEKNVVKKNFFYERLSLDIFLEIDNVKIDVEYDSCYWHNPISDRRRDEFLKKNGFKILRIKSRKKIPEMDMIIQKINYLLTTDKKYSYIILDDWDEEEYKKLRKEE